MTTKSIRLNQTIRAEIVSNVMTSYDKENPLPPQPKDSWDDLYEAVLCWWEGKYETEIKQFRQLDKEYPNLVKFCTHITFTDHLGNTRQVYFHSRNERYCTDDNRYPEQETNVPNIKNGYVIDLSNPDTEIPESIQKVIDAIKGEKKAVRKTKQLYSEALKEREYYEEQVTQVVGGVNTTKQLLEVWSEVGDFLPRAIINPSNIQLPSVNITTLNSKIGK